MSFRCLVCGYDEMPHPPRDYNICPCCGVEFGLDDAFESHRELRDAWLQEGAPWFSSEHPFVRPVNWDAWDQLELAGLQYDVRRPMSAVKTDIVAPPEGMQLCHDECFAVSVW